MPRPHFAIARRLNDGHNVRNFSPPEGVRDFLGDVLCAEFASRTDLDAVGLRSGLTASQKAGLRYEARVGKALVEEAPNLSASYLPGPWIRFTDRTNSRHWCQPDGILVSDLNQRVIVCEMKNTHTVDAYWQLMYKYVPVVQSLFSGYEVIPLEFARTGDPLMPWPVNTHLCSSVSEARLGVYNLILGFAK